MKVSAHIGNGQLMQRINRTRVFDCIRRNQSITRPRIAAETGLSLASITNVTYYLLDNGLITELTPDTAGHVGRTPGVLQAAADSHHIACVAAEPGELHGAVVDLRGEMVFSHGPCVGGNMIACIEDAIVTLCRHSGSKLQAAAVSVPGIVLQGGRIVSSVPLAWTGLDLRTRLEQRVQEVCGRFIPVFVQNSSISRAVWLSAKLKKELPRNAVFLDLQNGIGAVRLSRGRVDYSFLGELGHTTVDAFGPACFCGNRGCLELYCSPSRVISDFNAFPGCDAERFGDVVYAEAQGNHHAHTVLERCGVYLGSALVTLVQLTAPGLLLINAHELGHSQTVMSTAEQYLRTHAYADFIAGLTIRCTDADSHLSNDWRDSVQGLAEYVMDRLFDVESSYCIIT